MSNSKYLDFKQILNEFYEEDIKEEQNISLSINEPYKNIENIDEVIHQYKKYSDKPPQIKFYINKINENEFEISIKEQTHFEIIKCKNTFYYSSDNAIYKLDEIYLKYTLKILNIFKVNLTNAIKFSYKEMPMFFSLITPKLKENIIYENIDLDDLKKFIPEQLIAKLYLDFDDNNYIVADLKFEYNEFDINPLNIDISKTLSRNIIEETKYLNILIKTGFMLDRINARFVLIGDDKIYDFITNGIDEYMLKFEVYITDNFSKKKIKLNRSITLGVKIQNDLLNIDLTGIQIDKNEIKEIMQKYISKKKYHRLKNGQFIDLENNQNIEFLNNLITGLNLTYKDMEEDYINIPINRSLYLNRLLNNSENIKVLKDDEFDNIIDDIESKGEDNIDLIPKSLDNILRYYQKIGYKWLKNIDKYKMGGILADDMGLGKTIQSLAIVLSYIERVKPEVKKASIVISPSSLMLNWKDEIEKFAQSLKVLIINGTQEERVQKINEIPKYDLIITSYDLLKRDVDLYIEKDYGFKYIIADEAQYIKNNLTKNAKAIKSIKAETRYALTGTPIENSLAELWSIFDFIMPGYLFKYKKFKQEYEIPIIRDNNTVTLEKLKMLIEPFILRRTKKEVLKELPDKVITVLNNEMTEEQSKIYMSYLAQARNELTDVIEEIGFNQSRIKILALLTRLRQICCHPSLFIENYKEGSGKLKQCVDIIKSGINSGHKILLFSGYTSMFEIIEKELRNENINYYKLTGQTKINERVDLVNRFNKNDNIKVFLISLKAGGTGLNLTGADMVIHYDPWWNISVENQATDRTHRIGQKKKVQVYKLITKNSIEEKIYELQKKKEELIDNMLSTDTKFINTLSKEEIMQLFE